MLTIADKLESGGSTRGCLVVGMIKFFQEEEHLSNK